MPETLSRQQRWQEKQIEEGKCRTCGEPAGEKPNSTPEKPKYYLHCKAHREADLARKAA